MTELYLLALSFFGLLYVGVAIMFFTIKQWFIKKHEEQKKEIEELRNLLNTDVRNVIDNVNKLLK